MRNAVVPIAVVVLASVGLPHASPAQAAGCTYDRCALRIQYRPFADRIVQGADEKLVARLGMFASHIAPLADASGTVRTHYEEYRTRHNRGAALGLVGAAANIALAFVLLNAIDQSNDNPPAAAWVLAAAGIGFSIAGGVTIRGARDHLARSIWHYNRSVATGAR
jgi:hypothetical protein